jgi:ATP-dependent DNA helicase DinG
LILTKLPFTVPDHPLIQARLEYIDSKGGNSFMDYSLPEAVLKFRQGAGRLIRSKSDEGIITILDFRIISKQYGKYFLNALEECPIDII